MKIVFFGMNSPYSILPLLAIRQEFGIEAVLMSGREKSSLKETIKKITGYKSTGPFSIFKTCFVYGLPLKAFDSVNGMECIAYIKGLRPDVICMSGFNEKLGRELISIPPHGVINAHSSLLPDFKGGHPFYRMIQMNRFKPGCTIHRVNEKLDEGAILEQQAIDVYEGMSLSIYNTLVAGAAAHLFCKVLTKIASGSEPASIDNNNIHGADGRNPGAKDLVLSADYTVKQLLWLFNAYSDSFSLKVLTPAGEKLCTKLSIRPFEGSSVFKAADGKVYIAT